MLGTAAEPSFEALKQAAGRGSLGQLRDPRFLKNMALLNPGALATLPDARPKETQNKIQTDRSRVTWHRKANGCQETALKLPGPWHQAWSSARRVNSGIGVVVIFFCQSTGFRLGREDLPGSSMLRSSLKVNVG